MKSKVTIGGHPVHPMLVVLPIGLFVWAFVSNLIYIAGGQDRMWYDISYWTGIAAIVSALLAAIPGLVDYRGIARHTTARTIASAHMVLNIVVVAAFASAAILQYNGNALEGGQMGAAFALHAFGAATLMVAAWMGGDLVYRHHISVLPDEAELNQPELARPHIIAEMLERPPSPPGSSTLEESEQPQ
jgi:uncharacterized membrane protein